MKISSLFPLLALASPILAALPPVTVKGNAFWDSETNERFYIRGVDYQPGGSSKLTDPLADEATCTRDIPYFQELGLNTIRVYTVDNSASHDACMKALDEAGIYLILDVNTPDASISRADAKCSYNAAYLQSVFATIDAFADYDNVLGFFAANEVIDSDNTTSTATYVKAVVRDMKNYLQAREYRQIPVGYSAADVSSNRLQAAQYFNCGNDSMAKIDMFGVNDYSWCGDSSFTTSGYSEKVEMYTGYSKPIFLSEFGCNTADTRPFSEIEAIYSDKMSSVFSGGLVYEYSQEDNNYGVVEIDGDSVSEMADFANLQQMLNSTTDPSGDGGYSEDNDDSECPEFEEGTWEADDTLPDMPSAASIYFSSGAGEPQGTGYETQWRCGEDPEYESDTDATTDASDSSETGTSDDSSSASGSDSTSDSSGSSTSESSAGVLQVPFFYHFVSKMLGSTSMSLTLGVLGASFVAALV